MKPNGYLVIFSFCSIKKLLHIKQKLLSKIQQLIEIIFEIKLFQLNLNYFEYRTLLRLKFVTQMKLSLLIRGVYVFLSSHHTISMNQQLCFNIFGGLRKQSRDYKLGANVYKDKYILG
jgi:hypothetical protein